MRKQRNKADSAKSAIEFLAAESSLNMTGAKAQPDPQVKWVWKVTTPNDTDIEFAVVYLDDDDFECQYRDDDGPERSELESCLGL